MHHAEVTNKTVIFLKTCDLLLQNYRETPVINIIGILLIRYECYMNAGVIKTWEPHERLPPCTLRTLFSRFLDITTPPTPNLLQHFASLATDPEDQQRLTLLATVSNVL
jgi:sulfite reductase alpha subunit-like flavoprotein